MAYIYALMDPISGDIRYVGKTSYNSPEIRLGEHIGDALVRGSTYHVHNWIRKLVSENIGYPILEILETCDESNWQEREKFWIKVCKDNGYNLTNMTDGGECSWPWNDPSYRAKMAGVNKIRANGLLKSPEIASKRSIAVSKALTEMWSDPVRKSDISSKISKANAGKPKSVEHRKALSKAHKGVPLSNSHRENMLASIRRPEIQQKKVASYHARLNSNIEFRAKLVAQGTFGAHNRWHRDRKMVDLSCPFCQAEN